MFSTICARKARSRFGCLLVAAGWALFPAITRAGCSVLEYSPLFPGTTSHIVASGTCTDLASAKAKCAEFSAPFQAYHRDAGCFYRRWNGVSHARAGWYRQGPGQAFFFLKLTYGVSDSPGKDKSEQKKKNGSGKSG
jgi:hypothetical protein